MGARPVLLVRRDRLVKIRCTDEEWDFLQRKANEGNWASVSDFVRHKVGLRTKPVMPRLRTVHKEIVDKRKKQKEAQKPSTFVLPWNKR